MAPTIEQFKKAFAGKTTGGDLKAHDERIKEALKKLDASIEALGQNAAAAGFRSERESLGKEYRKAREKSGRPISEIAKELDKVISDIGALTTRVNAVPKDDGWSISPDGDPKQAGPIVGLPGGGLPPLDPKLIEKMMEEDRKKQEKKWKEAEAALGQARKWLVAMPKDELRKLSYPAILVALKEKFPAVGDLQKPKSLMDMVDKVLTDNGYLMDKSFVNDPSKQAIEKFIAAYIAALPSNVKAEVTDSGIRLVTTGAGGGSAAGSDEKPGDKKPAKFEFKNKYYTIQVTNEAWKALDPALRAKWKSLNDEATALEKLMATLTSMKKTWESEKDGSSSKVELEARIKDLEAEFKGRWETLQNSINATAKLTTDGLKASITEAKKKIKDDKVGAELQLKFDEMSAGVKVFASTPDLKTALTITGSAEKITAKIEAEAIKSGTIVTLDYEKALEEVKEQLKLQVKQGNTAVAATLSKEATKLEEKLKALKDGKSKDFKDVKALEEGLDKLKLDVTTEFKSGNFKVSVGGNVATGGEVGGKVKVDFVLAEGLTFRGSGPTISFSANVSNKGYTFELMFKLGDMPDLKDVHSANKQADEKIKELYKLVKDNRIRSMDDAKQIQEELSKVMKPLKKSVESMKKLDKKKFGFEVGVTITGEFPSGGRAPPPTAGFGIKIIF